MKKLGLLLTLFAFALVFHANAQNQASGPVITFKETSIDFGDIVQGAKVEHTFVLTNSGIQRSCYLWMYCAKLAKRACGSR
jgi:hypothetical protein